MESEHPVFELSRKLLTFILNQFAFYLKPNRLIHHSETRPRPLGPASPEALQPPPPGRHLRFRITTSTLQFSILRPRNYRCGKLHHTALNLRLETIPKPIVVNTASRPISSTTLCGNLHSPPPHQPRRHLYLGPKRQTPLLPCNPRNPL